MAADSSSSIGNNIRKWRILKGFKQVDFAMQIGISKTTLSKIENNKRYPTTPRLLQIANCLQIKTTDLFTDPKDLLPPKG